MKILYSNFDPQSGESIVTLVNRNGSYTGKAKLHPEDNNPSNFTGCRLAERRAYIKYLKNERRRYKITLKTILSLYKDLTNNCSDSINEKITNRFNIQINFYKKTINEINKTIEDVQNTIKEEIKIREKILEAKVKK